MRTVAGDLGIWVVCVDLEVHASLDLLDDTFFERILGDIEAHVFDGVLTAPPCSTFSPKRSAGLYDGGPRPLRGDTAPAIYGVPDLTPQEKTAVRIGTACALRAVSAARAAHKMKIPFLVETAALRVGHPNVFKLPEAREFMQAHGDVMTTTFVQCPFGARTAKPTCVMHNFLLPELAHTCKHEPQWWTVPWSGISFFQAHPPLEGKQWAVPSSSWSSSMLRSCEPQGPFISRSSALYSMGLNLMFATAFHRAFTSSPLCSTAPAALPATVPPRLDDAGGLRPLQYTQRLRGDPDVPTTSDPVGGMRRTAHSMRSIPGHMLIGPRLSDLFEAAIVEWPSFLELLTAAVDRQPFDKAALDNHIHDLRIVILKALGSTDVERDGAPVTGNVSTNLRAHLIHLWASLAKDPALVAVPWLWHGAPAGITSNID